MRHWEFSSASASPGIDREGVTNAVAKSMATGKSKRLIEWFDTDPAVYETANVLNVMLEGL